MHIFQTQVNNDSYLPLNTLQGLNYIEIVQAVFSTKHIISVTMLEISYYIFLSYALYKHILYI